MGLKFTKMHGCGNDYVYVNMFQEKVEHPGAVSQFVSDRHMGIGADGLILICPSEKADFAMKMYNADGSEGAMCGNGVRCIAKYVYEYGLTQEKTISLETKAGIKYLDLTVQEGKVTSVKVNMGHPILKAEAIPVRSQNEQVVDEPILVDGKEYRMTAVSMGNPHAVVFVEDTDSLNLMELGPKFEHHERFPDRVNTEFVQVIDRHNVNMRVWERGSGETLACGTGTCATAVACVLNGVTENEITVHLKGGDIHIQYDQTEDIVWMTGPATVVFDGEIELPEGIC